MAKDTKFKPGQSGNPDGRPKGSKDKRTQYREMLEPHAEALISKVVELALAGDTTSLKLCLDRLVSPFRAKDAPVHLDGLAGSLSEQGAQILSAMGNGVIAPADAAAMLSALAAQSRVIETEELEQRIEKLEKANGAKA